MKTIILNGRIIDSANQLDTITDLTIENGLISHIGQAQKDTSAQIIEAKGMWVVPGLVDTCCRPHLQHPHGTTLADEAKAAAKCGFTALCIPPDGDLIIDSTANVARQKQQGESHLPHLFPIGALTKQLLGESMTDMSALAKSGCIALSQAMQPMKDLTVLKHCYHYASSFNLLIVIQPFEAALSQGGIIHEGVMSAHLGLPGIPTISETIAIAQHLALIKETGVNAHFTCLSSRDGVELIRQAKKEGLKITADCAMHSLHLTEMDVANFDANCHVYPPLRSLDDREGLLEGLRDGTLDAICSDHRPLDSVAKLAPFGDTTPGLSSIDTFLGLGLHLVAHQNIPLPLLFRSITHGPARIFNLPAGSLSLGAKADVCIIDPSRSYQVGENALHSNGRNSPFKNWELEGQVVMTLINGMIVHEN